MSTKKQLTPRDYTVGWLCALAWTEQSAAVKMLDEKHQALPKPDNDDNTYYYGSINGHNIVIACMPLGQPGTISAARLVEPLPTRFPNMKIHLFVGIGGGIPRNHPTSDPDEDIRLGDVVVGVAPTPGVSSIVQHDFIRDHGEGGGELLGSLDKPDRRLLTALNNLITDHVTGEDGFHKHLGRLTNMKYNFTRPDHVKDRLYRSAYKHVDTGPNSTGCDGCDPDEIVNRKERQRSDPLFHQGQILSGNSVIENSPGRDELSRRFPHARCVETEAAGVVDQTHCLVIRGVAGYADSHKNQEWQPYAAGTAAAFARQFLMMLPPKDVRDLGPVTVSQSMSCNITTLLN